MFCGIAKVYKRIMNYENTYIENRQFFFYIHTFNPEYGLCYTILSSEKKSNLPFTMRKFRVRGGYYDECENEHILCIPIDFSVATVFHNT